MGETAPGRYIDWAFAGSEQKSLIKTSCFGGGKDLGLTKEDVTPSSDSNRAMAVEVGLDKEKIGNIYTALGNELACIDANIPVAKPGVVSGLVIMLRHFVQTLNPFVSLQKIEFEPGMTKRDFSGEEVRFHNEYFGALTHARAKLKDLKVIFYEAHEKKGRPSNNSKGMVFSEFYRQQDAPDRSKPLTFTFDLKMFEDFKSLQGVSDGVITHSLKYRRDAAYSSKLKKFKIKMADPTNFQIRGVHLENLDNLLLYEQRNHFSTLLPRTPLMIQLGSHFPVQLVYDKDLGLVSYNILVDSVPSEKKEKKLTDVSVQTGLVNLLNDSRNNKHFLNRLSALNTNPPDLEISFYGGEPPFVCSAIRTEAFRKNIFKQEIPNNKPKQNVLKSQKTLLDKSDDFKGLEKLCEDLLKGDFDQNVRNSMRFKMNKHTSVPMISTTFLNMAGQKVNLKYSGHPLEESEKKQMDNGQNTKEVIELNGLIVAMDSEITGTPETKRETGLPPLKEFTSQKQAGFLPFPLTSLGCGSFSPYLPVESPLIREAALRRIQLKKTPGPALLPHNDRARRRLEQKGVGHFADHKKKLDGHVHSLQQAVFLHLEKNRGQIHRGATGKRRESSLHLSGFESQGRTGAHGSVRDGGGKGQRREAVRLLPFAEQNGNEEQPLLLPSVQRYSS